MVSPVARRAALALPLLALAVPRATEAQDSWQAAVAGVEALRRAAPLRGLTGSWDRPGVPIRATLLPPAGETRVARVEAAAGRAMPPGLRRFFRETSAGVDIQWLLPGAGA